MTHDQWLISAVLLLLFIMFAWGRWRHDLVAMSALVFSTLLGLVPVEQAFSGFGHPAVITVAAVLIISHALKRAGVVDLITGGLAPLTKHPMLHIASLTLVVTVASAFMNNVGALALMLPVAIATAKQQGRSPAMLLMPLAFGSILGGMTTLIGTPPNIIIATMRSDLTGEAAFKLFDFAWVGLPVAVAGFLFVIIIGWRLLPRERREKNIPDQLFDVGDYLTELEILPESPLIGRYLRPVMLEEGWDIQLVGLLGKAQGVQPMPPGFRFQEGDVLIASGKAEDLQPVLDSYGLQLRAASASDVEHIDPQELEFFEGIVSAQSKLVNRNVRFLRRESGDNLSLVGLSRHGENLRKRLRHIRFRIGDVLLLQGRRDEMDEQLQRLSLLPLAPRDISLGQRRNASLSLIIFIVAICLGLFELMPLYLAFLLAIFGYIVIGMLPVHQLYDEVDWPVIVLLGAMIPVGKSLETTGMTELVASNLTGWSEGMALYWIIALVLVVTMFMSDIINNAATALVMAPIAVGISQQLGVSADGFLMAVAVGASCAFLTPIGHQSNTLVMGPGGYKFSDYWRMGLPLEVIIVAVAVPLIMMVWF